MVAESARAISNYWSCICGWRAL